MYYDPMIAKLCTWAPTREKAIGQMREALDSFEVEGIGHNLPFLSAVMDHARFVKGDITTAFIEEEYPDGFVGVDFEEEELMRIAASCAAMNRVAEIRRTKISGRMDNHERRVGDNWIVTLQNKKYELKIVADQLGSTVQFTNGDKIRVEGRWTPGDQLAKMLVDETRLTMKVGKITGGFRIRNRGADLKVLVRSKMQSELADHMIEKIPPDTSKILMCPMPGLIVKIDVQVGQEVQEGQALCTVEAMKMENILRADRKAKVKKVNVKAGDSLAVDETIMEFE